MENKKVLKLIDKTFCRIALGLGGLNAMHPIPEDILDRIVGNLRATRRWAVKRVIADDLREFDGRPNPVIAEFIEDCEKADPDVHDSRD